jgi:hypothetical protein
VYAVAVVGSSKGEENETEIKEEKKKQIGEWRKYVKKNRVTRWRAFGRYRILKR